MTGKQKVVKKPTPKKYHLKLFINGKIFEAETDDIDKALYDLKPDKVVVPMFVEIRAGDRLIERRVTAIKARQIFNEKIERQIFIQNLLLD